ncbi:Hydrogen cyanide synthase subunit HcnC precursor [Botrimarina colliarenosi]|uniref:Hydrogen cyanide synthase subunit HcnC n=1 Tax=Botrimarina colliarenosi TaxID=2528001 RepID=A0A5C6AIA1_9BACT|nr:FAD-dependent oxidoreductase [Botrimarina colliarenosi]TWT99724.1 Hydrogen cyanide synthase subunit HcnC precursor [Botrimarina colliarenosi]
MTRSDRHDDAVVVGGGVIGLSIAYELACEGLSVTLLERGELGKEASWAGAGILPPASWYTDHPAIDAMARVASLQHASLSKRLCDETGIDDEYDRCGADYVETAANRSYLQAAFARWQSMGIDVDSVAGESTTWRVPSEAQVRNPLRLQALEQACRLRGVRIETGAAVEGFQRRPNGPIEAVVTAAGRYRAGAYCLCAGAWTPELAQLAWSRAPGRPVRGQMLLLRPTGTPLRRIVHRYPHYAVPRRDGLVLVGATVEEQGFSKTTTTAARDELLEAARAIHPALGAAMVERQWAGLRPASADALPQIGPLPGVANGWVASGHHRCGLQLSPPTAVLISAMIRRVACDLPTTPFDPARRQTAALA